LSQKKAKTGSVIASFKCTSKCRAGLDIPRIKIFTISSEFWKNAQLARDIRVKKSLSDESVIIFWEISSYHWDKVFKTLEISGAHEISGAREVSEFHNDYQLKW